MNDYSMILDNMKFSYSAVNGFETCALGFKYSYVDIEERMGNAFSDFGSFCHKILEMYFKNELDKWELSTYYQDNYDKNIKCSFPTFPRGMAEKYYQEGLAFFEGLEFDKTKYEILGIEKRLETKIKDLNIVVVPDLFLKDKDTGEFILYDYKTANLFQDGRINKKKMQDIKKQMNLYVHFIWLIQGIEITKVKIWAIRNNKLIEYDYSPTEGAETLSWFLETVEKIKKEEEWNPNTKEKYFCDNICSSRFICPFINGTQH